MSDRQHTREIDKDVLATIGLDVAIAMFGVARDLRSGIISEDRYKQENWVTTLTECGTAYCIGGWTAVRLGAVVDPGRWAYQLYLDARSRNHRVADSLSNLFCGRPSVVNNPTALEAADAIERFLFRKARNPWRNTP